jgi:hypothetical protein
LTFVLSGEIELITNLDKYFKGLFHTHEQGHIVTFIEDTTLLVIFTPKMNGLEIEFKNRIMRLDDCKHDALHEREGLRLKPYLDTQRNTNDCY